MNCLLYQLRFNTPVHFGSPDSALSLYTSEDHFRADTLFSALGHTALQLYGEEGLNKLVSMAKNGTLLLSDSMPWAGSQYYLPKPCFAAQSDRELPADQRKAVKKLAWIPAERMEEYCAAMKTGDLFSCDPVSFGKASEVTKAMIPEQGDTLPYTLGLYHFQEDCGLYFLAGLEDAEERKWFTTLVEALGISGIGGRVTAGYGKYSVECVKDLTESGDPLWKKLTVHNGSKQPSLLLLTTSLPRREETETVLEDSSFQLVRRAGFAASHLYGQNPRKKQTQYFLSAGAVVKRPFSGDVYEIGDKALHPVWRYGKPMFLGVSL
jgi:CRISPR-associated protein Csm4